MIFTLLDSGPTTVRFKNTFRRRGILLEFLCRASRTSQQLAAAIRTSVFKNPHRTLNAESALEGADECILRFRWKVTIAAFAVRSQLQHLRSPANES